VYAGHVDKLDNELLRTHALQLLDLCADKIATSVELAHLQSKVLNFAEIIRLRSTSRSDDYDCKWGELENIYCVMTYRNYQALALDDREQLAPVVAQIREMVIRDLDFYGTLEEYDG
jgi:hypothetical protein